MTIKQERTTVKRERDEDAGQDTSVRLKSYRNSTGNRVFMIDSDDEQEQDNGMVSDEEPVEVVQPQREPPQVVDLEGW